MYHQCFFFFVNTFSGSVFDLCIVAFCFDCQSPICGLLCRAVWPFWASAARWWTSHPPLPQRHIVINIKQNHSSHWLEVNSLSFNEVLFWNVQTKFFLLFLHGVYSCALAFNLALQSNSIQCRTWLLSAHNQYHRLMKCVCTFYKCIWNGHWGVQCRPVTDLKRIESMFFQGQW